MGVGGGSEAFDVEDRKRGVRDGLADDAFGSGPKGRIQLILTAEGRNEATLDAHLVQTVCEQVERAAVDRGACHQMVTALTEVEHGKEVGGLSRTCEHGRRASLESRDLCRDVIVGGVLQARVEVARFLKVEKPPHGVRTVVFEGRGLHNGQLPRLKIGRAHV